MHETPCAINTFCTKLPILDAGRHIWGYTFFYKPESQDSSVKDTDQHRTMLQAAADSLQGATGQNKQMLRICTAFPDQSVIDGMPYLFSCEQGVIELQDNAYPSQSLLNSLQSLRNKNYSIALEIGPGIRHSPEMLRMADILKADPSQISESKRAALVAKGHERRATMLAQRIDSQEAFQNAREAGFNLFEGFFFQQPEASEPRALSSMESTRLRLFRLLQSPEPDFGALGEVIQADVSLSYRLLSLLNSPAFKLVRRIESVGQALVMLGWQQLKNWLLVVILSDLMTPGKCPELVVNSAQRAKFFELASQKVREPAYAPETLFLLGLFSLLEAMMDIPMKHIAVNLPLDDPIKEALCGQQNACFRWLELAENFETRNWDQVRDLLAAFQLDPLEAANAYHASTLWANSMLTLF